MKRTWKYVPIYIVHTVQVILNGPETDTRAHCILNFTDVPVWDRDWDVTEKRYFYNDTKPVAKPV